MISSLLNSGAKEKMRKLDSNLNKYHTFYQNYYDTYGRSYTDDGHESFIIHLKRDIYDLEKTIEELNKPYIDCLSRTVRSKRLRDIKTLLIAPTFTEEADDYTKKFANNNKYYWRPGMPKITTTYKILELKDFINRLVPFINPRCYEQFIQELADCF